FFAGDRPGFFAAAGVYVPEGHNLWRGLHNAANQLWVTSDVLFGWPHVSLVPALAGVLAGSGTTGERPRSFERALRALLAGYLAFLVIYHNPGFAYGTRFHYALLPAFAWGTAVGLKRLSERFPAVPLVVLYLVVQAAVAHDPRRIADLSGYWRVWP